jgi:hypothetical protein
MEAISKFLIHTWFPPLQAPARKEQGLDPTCSINVSSTHGSEREYDLWVTNAADINQAASIVGYPCAICLSSMSKSALKSRLRQATFKPWFLGQELDRQNSAAYAVTGH